MKRRWGRPRKMWLDISGQDSMEKCHWLKHPLVHHKWPSQSRYWWWWWRTYHSKGHNNHQYELLLLFNCYLTNANNRITEEDQSRGNEMLPPPFAHFIQIPHHKWNSVQKIQAAIGPYEDIFTTVKKKEVTMVRTCGQIKWPLQKHRTRHSTMKKRKAKVKMGKQHQRGDRSRFQQQSESSRGLSEMEEDCRRCQQWCPSDPDGSGHR